MTILGDPEESSRHQNYSAFDTNGTPDAIQALASSKTELKGREEFEKLLFIYDNKLRSGALLCRMEYQKTSTGYLSSIYKFNFSFGGFGRCNFPFT